MTDEKQTKNDNWGGDKLARLNVILTALAAITGIAATTITAIIATTQCALDERLKQYDTVLKDYEVRSKNEASDWHLSSEDRTLVAEHLEGAAGSRPDSKKSFIVHIRSNVRFDSQTVSKVHVIGQCTILRTGQVQEANGQLKLVWRHYDKRFSLRAGAPLSPEARQLMRDCGDPDAEGLPGFGFANRVATPFTEQFVVRSTDTWIQYERFIGLIDPLKPEEPNWLRTTEDLRLTETSSNGQKP